MTWLVTEALGALAGAFGGAEQVPNFLRAMVEEPGRFGLTDSQAFSAALATPDAFVADTRLVCADPAAWAFGQLDRNLPVGQNPLGELSALLARHGLEERYRLKVPVEETPITPSVVDGGVVTGLLKNPSSATIRLVSERVHRRFDVIATDVRQRMETANDRWLTVMDIVLRSFVTSVTVTGFENVPEGGRLVFAGNHPFAFFDVFALMTQVSSQRPGCPWMLLSKVNALGKYLPGWQLDAHFTDRIAGLKLSDGNPLENGSQAAQEGIDFLLRYENAMFFTAPEGPHAGFQDRIAQPQPLFARLAAEGKARIVPVLFTGAADLDAMAFRVEGKILPPYDVQTIPGTNVPHHGLTTQKWVEVLRAALAGTSQ